MRLTGATGPCAALFAAFMLLGCGAEVAEAPSEGALENMHHRRFAKGATDLYTATATALEELGATITDQRDDFTTCAKMDVARKPVVLYLKFSGADRVCVRFYNLSEKEEETWSEKLFEEIEKVLAGKTARRGGRRGAAE